MNVIVENLEIIKRRAKNAMGLAYGMWPYYVPIFSQPVSGRRFFCQNAGSCGSTYIVELLKKNGLSECYHEKMPALDTLGIYHYEGKVTEKRLKSLLIHTRRNVFFEANNRLFSMTKNIKEAFPESRFIYLHRDPRDSIRSSMSKPYELSYGSGRYRYNSTKLSGPESNTTLERNCHYWANYNQRILYDLEGGEDYLSLKFEDLVSGKLDALEEFIEHPLKTRKIPPANANKPIRKEGYYPSFDDWSEEDQATLLRICGPVMQAQGYKL